MRFLPRLERRRKQPLLQNIEAMVGKFMEKKR